MAREELASLLAKANESEQQQLLRDYSALADVQLGHLLKEICLEGWSSDTSRALAASSSLKKLFALNPEPEIQSLSLWATGLECLIFGRMENAITYLDASKQAFQLIDKPQLAAATQVSKLIALAYLGRYEEAIACGLSAREFFLKCGDFQAVGKIEHNIGNLYFRRDSYHEAEAFQSAARERFRVLNDQKQLATVNNCLANTHALLHKFKSAESLYEEAVMQAESAGLPVTLAGIEGNIGTLALLQGRYDRALNYLERSCRRYASLGMKLQAVTAEHEIADTYVELGLAPEAIEIYLRLIPSFAELGMRAEHARALAYMGRALTRLQEIPEALTVLSESRQLYAAECNEVGEAGVLLSQAQLLCGQQHYEEANRLAESASLVLSNSGSWQKFLLARWTQAETEREQGHYESAQLILEKTLVDAEANEQPQVAEHCLTSIGLIHLKKSETNKAEAAFRRAVALVEKLRAPLPGEEFRTAYFSSNLTPYVELARLCLGDRRLTEALTWIESARSRALAEALGANIRLLNEARDPYETDLLNQIETLSEELNYIYNQINKSGRQGTQSPVDLASLQREQHERESRMLKLTRQLHHRGELNFDQVVSFELGKLQRDLGPETALVEYATLDDELLAFVVTDKKLEVFRDLAAEPELSQRVQDFRFQIDALRYGAKSIRKHLPALTSRVTQRLKSLYALLIRPLEYAIDGRGLIIVPHRTLHYLPFHALHDGDRFLVERCEVSYSPSAVVFQQCLRRKAQRFSSATLFGVADDAIPGVRDEVRLICEVLPNAESFLDQDATLQSLRESSAETDILHLACHAQFRTDNPLFSALKLGNGWLTVREAYGLKLTASLVTLSACETGVNAVAPGEELIGMARGFLSAGAPSVLLSLWMVDDEATAELMAEFYRKLQDTASPSMSIRAAQMNALKERPHPFFWSPFALVGRP